MCLANAFQQSGGRCEVHKETKTGINKWRLEDSVRGQWAKERCHNRRDAVVKYKDRIQGLGKVFTFGK